MSPIARLGQRLTGVPARITDPEARRQRVLLASLLLVMLALGGLLVLLEWLVFMGTGLSSAVMASALVVLALAYGLTRLGHYRVPALATIGVALYTCFAYIVAASDESLAYAFLIFSITLAALLFSRTVVIVTAAINLLGVTLLLPAWGIRPPGGGPLVVPLFILAVTALMLLRISHRKAIERERLAELVASEERFRSLAQATLEGVVFSEAGWITDLNERGTVILGAPREAIIGRSVLDFCAPEFHETVMQHIRSGSDEAYQVMGQRADGTQFPVELHGRDTCYRGRPMRITVLRDLTASRLAEQRVLQLNRLLRTITEIDQVVVREHARQPLLDAACRILVEHGEFRMAWIGLTDRASGRVLPLASAGFEKGYLEIADIRCDDSPQGRGPTGTAIREARHVISHDIGQDPDFRPWRERALQLGYRSSAAFPLRAGGQIIGAVNVYSAQPQAFGSDEVDLLDGLVDDLGHALESLEVAAARERAEAALAQSEGNYRALTENANVGILVNYRGRHVYANGHLLRMLGFTLEEFCATGIKELVHPDEQEKVTNRFRGRLAGKPMPETYESVFLARDGQPVPVELTPAVTIWQGEPAGLVFLHDIRERRRSEAQMRKLSGALEQAADSVMITDRDGVIEYVNQAFETATGFRRAEVVGQTPRIIKSGRQGVGFYQHLWQTILAGKVFSDVIINRRKDGSQYFEEMTITPLKDEHGQITHFISTGKDVSERMQAQERLQYMAQHDALTDLPNRVLLIDRLKQALARARWNQRIVAVLFIDLDRFKNINDSLGHEAGDQLLQQLAGRFSRCVREGDTVARFGGDEFTILLDDVANEADVRGVAQKILEVLSPPFEVAGQQLYITCSIGVSLYPGDSEDSGTLLKNADIAMYRAKELGKNTYQFYSADMSARAFERLALESSLRHALERGEFRLHYQPQVDAESGRIVGVEALVRWQHPDFGLVMPADFISLLEDTALISLAGEWVLHTACAQLAAWHAAGWQSLRMAVNLSPRQLQVAGLAGVLRRALAESGCDPASLELEITESVLVQHAPATLESLEALRVLGVRLAIDDFGTGYSSLSYLRRFPIDAIKIDRSFVHDIPGDEDDSAITTAIIALGQSLKLEVIAEGVENREQREFLRRCGCRLMQGYLFSRPLPAVEITALLGKPPEQK